MDCRRQIGRGQARWPLNIERRECGLKTAPCVHLTSDSGLLLSSPFEELIPRDPKDVEEGPAEGATRSQLVNDAEELRHLTDRALERIFRNGTILEVRTGLNSTPILARALVSTTPSYQDKGSISPEFLSRINTTFVCFRTTGAPGRLLPWL